MKHKKPATAQGQYKRDKQVSPNFTGEEIERFAAFARSLEIQDVRYGMAVVHAPDIPCADAFNHQEEG
jgi:hypothetical protein